MECLAKGEQGLDTIRFIFFLSVAYIHNSQLGLGLWPGTGSCPWLSLAVPDCPWLSLGEKKVGKLGIEIGWLE